MVEIERCLTGRLAQAYPAAAHDVELRVTDVDPADLADVLRERAEQILREDTECRKVVFAARSSERDEVHAAEVAGFRYVVDVDLAFGRDELCTFSLLVREPEFVTRVDMDLDRVPGA